MTNLFLHTQTKSLLEAYVRRPQQGIILTGPTGVGLGTIARELAKQLSVHKTDIVLVEPDEKGTISIERIRTLYGETHSARKTRQVVLIDGIDAMSHDAQNAFLKLLEEPNDLVLFMLTSHEPEQLLPTVLSRVQQIPVQPISPTDSRMLLARLSVNDPQVVEQTLFIAEGLPAELTRLMQHAEYFQAQVDVVRKARDFIGQSSYERLVSIGDIKERSEAIGFVRMVAKIMTFLAHKPTFTAKERSVTALETTIDRLQHNAHVRTQLINLALVV